LTTTRSLRTSHGNLEPIRHGRHHSRRDAHCASHDLGQLAGPEPLRVAPVLCLLPLYPLDHRARPDVTIAEPIDVTLQVLLDLVLRFSEEPEVPCVAEAPRCISERERTGIPERVQQTQPAAELAHTLGTPREVIALLAGRFFQCVPQRFVR